jgi:DNA (cytosine-5)-methyltransferase 1
MTEIAALPWNGCNAISTFSGCGGSSLGYKIAGFRLLYANEFIPAAQETYRANHKGTILDARDIRKVQPQDILDAIGKEQGELDLMDGSPPCASFSTAGKRQAGWGKVKKYSDKAQRTDDLFFEFIRLLRDLKPKTFVAENVSGLIKGAAKGYFIEIMRELKASGYRVTCRVLDAQWLGVPQARQRTIFVGVREDIGLDPVHPKPLPYQYSVREVHPHLIEEKRGGTKDNWQITSRPASSIVASGGTVSPTAYLSGGSFYKTATETRRLTIEELRPLCGFPDDYILSGNYAQQWERCGRSVPPVMMSHIAATIRDEILTKIPR